MPVPTVSPNLDPNWAWDVPGWTNQVNTGDVQSSLGPGGSAFGSSGAGLNGYVGQTLPYETGVTNASGATFATNTFYGTLVYVAEGAVTTKVALNQSTTGTTTHAYALLFSVGGPGSTTGTLVANTADATNTAISTGAAVSWAASATLAPGYYYVGLAYTNSVSPQVWGVSPTNAAQSQLNSASTNYLPRCVSASYTVTGSLASTVTSLAAHTTVGIPWMIFY